MITQAELTALDWIQAHLRSGAMDAVMQVITLFGEYGVFWILLALGLLIYPRTRKLGLAMVFALLLDVVLCNGILKPLVARPRPYTWRPELEVIRQMRDYSFPSGHTAAAFAGTFALMGMRCRGWIPALALSILIGLSRLYLYMHFPTDVLCGAIVGIVCGLLGAALAKWCWKAWEKHKSGGKETLPKKG